MLRNQSKYKQLIHQLQQHNLFHSQVNVLNNKSTNVFRQAKVMGKLFGSRVKGSKKPWFPSTDSKNNTNQNVFLKPSHISKAGSGDGKNVTRRMAVLNKLFMKHITDLMATGEISENMLGKGLQIAKVKISQDFAFINVYWLATGEPDKDAFMEQELQRCSGLLRHELSQLELMGSVPRIKFVKDKFCSNMNQIDALLRNMDFGPEDDDKEFDSVNESAANTLKQEFYGQERSKENSFLKEEQTAPLSYTAALQSADLNVPEMRHDVLGLDHKNIMFKILTKMRKSKQAWDQYQQGSLTHTECTGIPSTSYEQLAKVNEKLANAAANAEKFNAFLEKRKERRNTPERKKYRAADHPIHILNINEEDDYNEFFMSARDRQIIEGEDYLAEDMDDKYK